MPLAKKIHRLRGPHEAKLTPATIGNLRKASEPAAVEGQASQITIPIRHSPMEEFGIWTRLTDAVSGGVSTQAGKYARLSVEDALRIAAKGRLEQRIELASSTPHAEVQIALGRDTAPSVYDTLISSSNLKPKAARVLMTNATIGQNWGAASFLKGRLDEMGGSIVKILPKRQANPNNRVSRRV